MRAAPLVFLLAGILVGCQKADRLDSANPVHCLTVFGLTAAGADGQSNAAVTNDMKARQLGLVQSNGGIAWLEEVTPDSQRLAAEIEAARDEASVLRLLDECVALHPPG